MSDSLKAFELVKGPHRLKGPLMKGVAAALLLDGVGPIVIMAPDMDKLNKAYGKITHTKVIEEHTIFAIGQYKKRTFDKMVEEILNDDKPNQLKKLLWCIHQESGCCFIEVEDFEGDGLCSPLGEAIKQTERECKQLLSKVLGLSMKEINDIKINTELPIPF